MHIDTTSQQRMESSVCEVLNISKEELKRVLEDCFNRFQKDKSIFILDNQYDYLYAYVKKHMCKGVDEISFYHLERKLNDNVDDFGYCVVDNLVKDSILSAFLKKYGITFSYDTKMHMYINGKEICVNEIDGYSSFFFKQFLEYDFNFKGLLFKDKIEEDDMYVLNQDGPEFFWHLFSFMDSDALISDFLANSKYYLFTYLIPISDIEFEEYEELSNQEKQYHVLVKVMQRLYSYYYDHTYESMENPVLYVLNHLVSNKYLVNKQLISQQL